MSFAHRLLAAIVPPPRDAWVRAHAAELESIEGRRRRLVWLLGVVPIVGWAIASQLRHEPASFLGGSLARAVAVGLSFLSVTSGLALLVVYVVDANAWPRLVIGIGLCVQGGYVLGYASSALLQRRVITRRSLFVGSGLAAVGGLTAFAISTAANIQPAGSDPEYGPMTMALLVATSGVFTLLAFGSRGSRPNRRANRY